MSHEIRKKALSYLARREHSAHELECKLRNKYDLASIRTVLKELAQENWQSDERFAQAYVRSRMEQGYGPLRIAAELKQRGIQEKHIQEVITTDPDFWQPILQKLYHKKITINPIENVNDKARIYRFLLQRGFEAHMIKKCCI